MAISFTDLNRMKLSSDDVNSILGASYAAATNDGFVNSFVLQRAAYVYIYLSLLGDNDRHDTVNDMIVNEGILKTFDELLGDGSLEKMVKDSQVDVNVTLKAIEDAFDDFSQYARSMRGFISDLTNLNGDEINKNINEIEQLVENGDIKKLLETAKNWGMNNK